MLLRHTTADVVERTSVTINPAKTCQPIGAMYAALGIHGCLPHSHGSQGCCAYHRSALTRHYKEPVMAATSSFTEGSAVFGGQSNLVQAISTIFEVYNPDIIAVHTTCLSETIGDDVKQITTAAADEGKVPPGKKVIYTNTPSYVGSHITGYSNMVNSTVAQLAVRGSRKEQVNVLAGWMEPSDMREIKSILKEFQVKGILLPDTSDVLDSPMTGKHEMYPKGGTTLPEIASMGSSMHTLALGEFCTATAAATLDSKFKVPFTQLQIPIGLEATDAFVAELSRVTGKPVPESLKMERGRLIDMIADMDQYLFHKKVALAGDPDNLLPLVKFLSDINMIPTHIVSGTPGQSFTEAIKKIVPNANVKNGSCADWFLLHQWIKKEKVDLLIGNSYGKYISRDDDIPFVRMGFPIYDRVGHSYFPVVGYKGAMRIVEKILGVLMDRLDRDAPETKVELVM
ncbi:MAG TPA: nitrogenase molybdenum-iron protein subunit beta [Fibrobacteraceae bacterium]|nr:nitrogenase molybdenum-iron protein subunit beta [Fibrobacteraceae bacterium]